MQDYLFIFLSFFWHFQVLFKNLVVDLKDVTPSSLLKDRARQVEGNPDFSNKDVGVPQQQIVAEVKSGTISALNQVELPLEVASPSHPGGHSHMLSQVRVLIYFLIGGCLYIIVQEICVSNLFGGFSMLHLFIFLLGH